MKYFLMCSFLFVVLSSSSWAAVGEGRVKCGETTTIYTNNSGANKVVTIMATDKCSGLDSAIIRSGDRWTIPDGQSTCISVVVSWENGTLKLECNGTNPKGYCTFSIIDVK